MSPIPQIQHSLLPPLQHCWASENVSGRHGMEVGQGFFFAYVTEEKMCQAARMGRWGSPKWSTRVAAFDLQQQQQ